MSFFKRKPKESEIPLPPAEQPSAQRDNRAELFAGAAPRDPYASRANAGAAADPYASRASSQKPVKQLAPESDPARAALFSGYNPNAIQRTEGRRQYDAQGDDGVQSQEQEDEDVESIKRDIRGVKQETLGSSRNALRIAREAEETARNALSKLGDQSERIASTERHLDLAKAASSRADDKTNELKKLNRSIFVPVVTWDKDGKRRVQEQRISDRHIDETADRQKARLDVEQTQRRLNSRELAGSGGSRGPTEGAMAARKEARKQYQFEATASDDELEDELDDNLEETLDVTKRLKALALASGEEIRTHNERLTRINDKAEGLDLRIAHNNERLKKIK